MCIEDSIESCWRSVLRRRSAQNSLHTRKNSLPTWSSTLWWCLMSCCLWTWLEWRRSREERSRSACAKWLTLLYSWEYLSVYWTVCCWSHRVFLLSVVFYYSARVGVQSIVINPSVCLFVSVSLCVCLSTSISLQPLDQSTQILCAADALWPWLGPLAALCYVMYFQFYGWRDVSP